MLMTGLIPNLDGSDQKPKCSVECCDRIAEKRKMCRAHYQRWRSYGDEFSRTPIVDVSSLHSRFNAKVGKKNENGCMEWQGESSNGYGRFNIGKITIAAHRISYEINVGAIPEGLFVCHKCDNPSCVNTEHLFVGTHQDNMQDMINKGRAPFKKGIPVPQLLSNKGSNHAIAILDEDKVKDIKLKLKNGIKGTVIAREYGVCDQAIYEIKNGKNWKHVE
jgi:hypothetical protein